MKKNDLGIAREAVDFYKLIGLKIKDVRSILLKNDNGGTNEGILFTLEGLEEVYVDLLFHNGELAVGEPYLGYHVVS